MSVNIGNYPWVGRARRQLGNTTSMCGDGDAVIEGIGPSRLNLWGIGGSETIPRLDRWGAPLFVGAKTAKPTRVYEANQPIQPRSVARAKCANPTRRRPFTEFMLHEFGGAEGLGALRSNDIIDFPSPGDYDVRTDTYHSNRPSAKGRFAPKDQVDGKRCTSGRSCDLDAAAPRMNDARLHLSRKHGPLFCKETARLARRRRPHSAMHANSSLAASFGSTHTVEERPTLKSFLRTFQHAVYAADGNGRGGSSFRLHHTVCSTCIYTFILCAFVYIHVE